MAKELGVWDVEGMLAEMSWQQYTGWLRYYSVEPFGEERADLRMAVGWSIIANSHRDPKRRPRPFTIRDFMLFSGSGGAHTRTYKPITDPGEWRDLTRVMQAAYGRKSLGEARDR